MEGHQSVSVVRHSRLGYSLEKHRFWRDPIHYLAQLNATHGLLTVLETDRPRYVFSFSPTGNQELSENSNLFQWAGGKQWTGGPEPLRILRASIANLDGPAYETRSKLMRPAFHHTVIEAARDTIAAETEKMLAGWGDGGTSDLNAAIRRMVHAASMKAVVGLDDDATIARMFYLIDQIYADSAGLGAMLIPHSLPFSPLRRVLRHAEEVISILRSAIRRTHIATGPPNDMLSMLARARTESGEMLTETEVVSETYNIMGHDTTVATLMWAIVLVALHPEVQRRVAAEATAILGGRAPQLFEIASLRYLDAVLKEVLRLMPPQCVCRRFNALPCEFGPHYLPENTIIFYSSYITHRLPELFPSPGRFLPERWESIRPGPYEYFPFGAGTHYCVGRALAMLEVKIVLATMFQRFRISLNRGQRIDRMPGARLLLTPKGPLPVRAHRHNGSFPMTQVTGNLREMVEL